MSQSFYLSALLGVLIMPLVVAGTAKMLAPNVGGPLFEGLLLRVPLVKTVPMRVAARTLGLVELTVTVCVALGGSRLLQIGVGLLVSLYAMFTFAGWYGFSRKLPCDCSGSSTKRPITVGRATTTTAFFMIAASLGAQLLTVGNVTLSRVVLGAVLVMGMAMGAGLVWTAWNRERRDVRQLLQTVPSTTSVEDSDGDDLVSVSRRRLLGGAPVLAAAAFLPTSALSRPGPTGRLFPRFDASGFKELPNVIRVLKRKGIAESDVAWRDARSSRWSNGIKFAMIPVGKVTSEASQWLLVAPRTRKGPAALVIDMPQNDGVAAVGPDLWELKDYDVYRNGTFVKACPSKCVDLGTACGLVFAVCCVEGCCAGCGGFVIGCCWDGICDL